MGLLIREFFIWDDDVGYNRRLCVRMKLPCCLVGRSTVTLAMKENNGSSIATNAPRRIARYNYAFCNEKNLYRQEGVKRFFYYSAKCALNVLRIITQTKDNRMRRSMIIIRQYLCGLFFNPKV